MKSIIQYKKMYTFDLLINIQNETHKKDKKTRRNFEIPVLFSTDPDQPKIPEDSNFRHQDRFDRG